MYTVIISDRGRFRIIFFGRDHIYLYAYLHFYFLWWSSDTFYPRIIFTTFPAFFFSTGILKNIFYTCHFTEYVTWTTLWWSILSLKYHCLDSHVQQVLFGISFYTYDFTECMTCSRVWWTHSFTEMTLLWFNELLAFLKICFKHMPFRSVVGITKW